MALERVVFTAAPVPARERVPVTAHLDVGTLYVPIAMHEQIMTVISQGPPVKKGRRNKSAYIKLLTLGLRQIRIAELALSYIETSRRIRQLLRGSLDLDLQRRPAPASVDPVWWSQQEEERILSGIESMRRAIQHALTLSRESVKVEKALIEEVGNGQG